MDPSKAVAGEARAAKRERLSTFIVVEFVDIRIKLFDLKIVNTVVIQKNAEFFGASSVTKRSWMCIVFFAKFLRSE